MADGMAPAAYPNRRSRSTNRHACGAEHQLVLLSILEDAAGHRIGRAVEVDGPAIKDRGPDPDRFFLQFRIPALTTP